MIVLWAHLTEMIMVILREAGRPMGGLPLSPFMCCYIVPNGRELTTDTRYASCRRAAGDTTTTRYHRYSAEEIGLGHTHRILRIGWEHFIMECYMAACPERTSICGYRSAE